MPNHIGVAMRRSAAFVEWRKVRTQSNSFTGLICGGEVTAKKAALQPATRSAIAVEAQPPVWAAHLLNRRDGMATTSSAVRRDRLGGLR